MSRNKGRKSALGVLVVLLAMCAPLGLLAQSVDGQSLQVGLYQNEPKVFRDQDGNPAGIFVDLLDAIAAQENWAITYVDCQWKTCLEMLEDGRLDLMPDVALTPERSRRFDFHDTAVVDSFSRVYAAPSDGIRVFKDLAGKRISVLAGSVQEAQFRTGPTGLATDVELVPTDSFDEAFRRVAAGHVDGVISNDFFGNRAARKHGLVNTPVVLQPAQLFFAAPAGNHRSELAAIDRHLNQWMRADSSPYYASLRKWTAADPREATPRWVVYMLLAGLGALALAGLLITALRRQVARRTVHLHERNQELRQNQDDLNSALKSLARSEAHSKRIIQGLPIAAVVWRESEGECVLESMNDAAVELMDAQNPSWDGRSLDDLYAPGHAIRTLVEESFDSERGARVEVRAVLCDGGAEKTLVLTSGFLEPHSVLVHLEDVTEHALMQRKLQVTQRLETAGLLAGGVAHDFNNLLTVINSSAEFALDDIDKQDPVREDIAIILEAGRKAAGVTRQLLAFSQNKVVEPKLISLSESVGEIATMLRHFIEENITLEFDLGSGADWIFMDPTQVEQIVLNLVLNARDAIRSHGHIEVSTRVDTSTAMAILQVRDTGKGMDEETSRRVFEPFFTTKEKDQGTGLGLATVYGAVTQANGTIDVVSQPGEGTTFTVEFPLADPGEYSDAVVSQEREWSPSEACILVVEDEDKVRRVVQRILVSAGYEILLAASVNQATAILDEGADVSLVLTDYIMPKKGGAELAEVVEQAYPHIKILFMSGYAAPQLHAHGFKGDKVRRHGLIQKPFSSEELISGVRSALED
jgi:signal transduction histidine kinase